MDRNIITRHEERDDGSSATSQRGEFANPDQAWETAYALCKVEHEVHLGFPPADERVQYPHHPVEAQVAEAA